MDPKELTTLQLLLIDFIEDIKKVTKDKEINYMKDQLNFDEQNVHDFFENYSRVKSNRIRDDRPSISNFLESLGYDERGKVINVSFPYSVIDNSKGLKIFVEKFHHRFPEIDDEGGNTHLLESVFCSVLQEYSDGKNGLKSILSSDLDYELLNKILSKYLNFLENTECQVEIFIPILGEIWFNKSNGNSLNKILDENVSLRLLTVEEQELRVYGGINDLITPDAVEHENEYNISNSNIAIVIKDTVKYETINLHDFDNAVYNMYKKYYLKINSLLNLISLTSEHNSISTDKVYFKSEGYLFNQYGSPINLWNNLRVDNRYTIDFIQNQTKYIYLLDDNTYFLDENHLKLVCESYNKIYKLSTNQKKKKLEVQNKEKLEGALLRRTRAKMDTSETEGLLDSIIGVEQLFSGGQSSELSFRISLYVSNILYKTKGFDTKSKKDIYTEFKKLYGKRSSFVHSGVQATDEKALMYLESLIREIIWSDKFDLDLSVLIATQTEDNYIFKEESS